MTDVLLVPSPLLGPATWDPVASWLRGRTGSVTVVGFEPAPTRPADVLDAVARAGSGLREVVLVPHSNAGLFCPALADLVDVAATVFVDAALPGDGPDSALAPPALLEMLSGLADADGRLPPWTEWWEDLTGVFPDAASRARVEAEQPRLPLSYFTPRVPVPDGWAERPCAYLAFGHTYAPEREYAAAHGWPTTTLHGRHLHTLHDPAAVGAAILDLLERLDVRA